MNNSNASFTPAELRQLRSLKNPHGIQRFLDEMPYHVADTAWSPRRILRESLAGHGPAELAAVADELNGRPRKTLGWKTPAEALAEIAHSRRTLANVRMIPIEVRTDARVRVR